MVNRNVQQSLFRIVMCLFAILMAISAKPAAAQKIIVNEFFRNNTLGGDPYPGNEWLEILLVEDLTAAQLEGFFVGDSTSATANKYAAYGFQDMAGFQDLASIAATFPKGTIIVVGGSAAFTEDITFKPSRGDWNLMFHTNNAHITTITSGGDFAGSDVAWVDTASSGSTILTDGFAVNWDTTPGTLGENANVTIAVPSEGTGAYLNSDLAGAATSGNWQTSVAPESLTPGFPNTGDNATYVTGLRNELLLCELSGFTATSLSDRILLQWQTASELDNAGFHLWRGDRADGFHARITDAMIPAEGGPAWGAEYAYEDWDVEPGTTYFYQLEDIDTAGVRTFHGPASAWPGVANIRAGDRDEPATAAGDQPVSVKVAVQAGEHSGTPVEYWVAVHTPFGWYSYGAQGWKPGIAPAAVGPLNDVAPLEVVNFPLTSGWYTFYLAVDDQINGQPDLTWVDSVEVEVEVE